MADLNFDEEITALVVIDPYFIRGRGTRTVQVLSLLCVSIASLQGIADRPLPCNYNCFTAISKPPRDESLLNPRFPPTISTHDSRVSHDFSST